MPPLDMPPLDHTTKELKLQNRTSITNELLQNIGTKCTNLLELNLYSCDVYSNDKLSSGLKYIADGCPLLKYIDLTGWDINPEDQSYHVYRRYIDGRNLQYIQFLVDVYSSRFFLLGVLQKHIVLVYFLIV